VENVNQKVHAIVKATKEQSIGSEQIVASVEKIRNITQENIKSFSEIKERIEYLSKQAELLKGEVKRFVI
jgi:methyl-accepting chemotaxis protein